MNKNYRRSENDFNRDLQNKNEYLKYMINNALKEDVGSSLRKEICVNIAVLLRVLFHKTKTQTPLLEQVDLL